MRTVYKIWLQKNGQSEQWLTAKIIEGFEIHHIDGNRQNNHPDNLVLMFGGDHRRLHGLFGLPAKPFNLNDLGRKGAQVRNHNLTAQQRSRLAQHAAKVRWSREA